MFIAPQPRGQIQDPPDHAEREVDALGLDTLLPPVLYIGLEASQVHLFHWQTPDIGIQLLQLRRVIGDAGQMQIFLKKLGCRVSKKPAGSGPEHGGLPDLLDPAGQDQFRRFEVACSSALVNLVAEDLLFDMPDSSRDS